MDYFFDCLDAFARLQFDYFLVQTDDQLAYKASSRQSRSSCAACGRFRPDQCKRGGVHT
jgi:hypothetical protein